MERQVLFIRPDQRAKLNSLAEEAHVSDVKIFAKEVRDIDKRVVRLETFIEIAKGKPKTPKILITED